MAKLKELKTSADAIYEHNQTIEFQEKIVAESAKNQWAQFASSEVGIVTIFIAGIFKDRMLYQPKQYAKLKSKRWLKLYIARSIQKLFNK